MEMYLVAVCDDETAELDKTERYLADWQESHQDRILQIERFTSAEELLEMVTENGYEPDLVVMDIYLQGQTGIEAAKKLRRLGSGCRIVFLTTSREHALDAFGVDATQYLVKPIEEAELSALMDRLFPGTDEKKKDYLLLRIDGRISRIDPETIVYVEAQGKSQRLHRSDGTYVQLHMTMTEIYGMLSGRPEFVRAGASYIVNLEHVDSLNSREICLDTGQIIYLPRGTYQPLRERYFDYYCEKA